MIKSDFSLRRFIDTFVPGFVVVIGIWYLYKPYFNKYFPVIAFDPAKDFFTISNELKLVLILIASVFAGVIVNHFADVPVAFIYKHYNDKEDCFDKLKWLAKLKYKMTSLLGYCLLFRFFISKDPRKKAMDRYAVSARKESFNKMINDWTNTTLSQMKKRNEEVIVHQHICARVRTLTPFSSKLYSDCYAEVIFASALQVSLTILFIATAFLLILNWYHDIFDIESKFSLKFIDNIQLFFLLCSEYILLK